MTDPVFNVLFLCTGNSARSIMAESILRKLGAGQFNAYSAGSHPKGAVNPFALKTIKAYGYPTEGLRSKSWNEYATTDAPKLDFAFTLCDDATGDLSCLAGTTDDGTLGHRRSCGGRGHRYRERTRVRPSVPLPEKPDQHASSLCRSEVSTRSH